MTLATPLSPARVRLALLALAVGGFGIGCTEFVVLGLLPNIAHDLLPTLSTDAANAKAGLLASAYALGVVVGAPTIAAFAARFPRKQLLVVLAAAFTFFTILSAVLPSFELVLGARFLAGLPHGAYFGIAALVAADLMGPGKRGAGVAFVLVGLTIANVVGVPLITFLGQATSWRVSYLAVAGVFALTLVMLLCFLPLQAGNPAATMKRELAAFGRAQVWLALLTGAVGFGGFFAVYTYVAPLTTNVAHLPAAVVPFSLVALGVGMTTGNLFGGWFADRGVVRAIFVFFGVFAASLIELIVTSHWPVGLFIGVFLVGFATSGLSPAIQTRLMDVAGDSQTLGAAANHSALNIGNSLGASLGGLVIAAGFGYVAPVWVGLGLWVPGILLFSASVILQHKRGGTIDGSHRSPIVPLNAE
ncbi:MAG: arabinose transporter permease [Microbacteriaceae bacterium]|nr:arabinose transporter permease [Microbacteriaceae bacterium]